MSDQSTTNTGGPAFPVERDTKSGMKLRDYFAAKAMGPLIASGSWLIGAGPSAENELMAAAAYAVADAMLAAREAK